MIDTQNKQRIERVKARGQMLDSERKRQNEYAAKKERLEKHYGYYIDPDDLAARDHKADMDYLAWQNEMDEWQKFAEKHVPDDEKAKGEFDVDKKEAWTAIFARQIRIHTRVRNNKILSDIGEKYSPQDLDIDNKKNIQLHEKYDEQISEMRKKMLAAYPPYCERPNRDKIFYKTKEGKTLIAPKAIVETNKVSARRLCFLIETCLNKHILNTECIHYLQAIDSGKKAPDYTGKIDTKDLHLYSIMFDNLKIARIIGGQDKDIAQRIDNLGSQFLTPKDLKDLQKIKPHYNAQHVSMMEKKFAESSL